MSDGEFAPVTAEVLDGDAKVLPPASPESEDIDVLSWLSGEAERAREVGYCEIDGRRLKIAPVTEAEDNNLMRQARHLNRTTNKVEQHPMEYRMRYVAFSLTKADPTHPVDFSQLNGALSGNITRLWKAIIVLSGGEVAKVEMPDPFGSLT